VQDRHASDEQYQKFQETGQRAFGLILVDEQKQNCTDKADRKAHPNTCAPVSVGGRRAPCWVSYFFRLSRDPLALGARFAAPLVSREGTTEPSATDA